jgi:hypothetical protein
MITENYAPQLRHQKTVNLEIPKQAQQTFSQTVRLDAKHALTQEIINAKLHSPTDISIVPFGLKHMHAGELVRPVLMDCHAQLVKQA